MSLLILMVEKEIAEEVKQTAPVTSASYKSEVMQTFELQISRCDCITDPTEKNQGKNKGFHHSFCAHQCSVWYQLTVHTRDKEWHRFVMQTTRGVFFVVNGFIMCESPAEWWQKHLLIEADLDADWLSLIWKTYSRVHSSCAGIYSSTLMLDFKVFSISLKHRVSGLNKLHFNSDWLECCSHAKTISAQSKDGADGQGVQAEKTLLIAVL